MLMNKAIYLHNVKTCNGKRLAYGFDMQNYVNRWATDVHLIEQKFSLQCFLPVERPDFDELTRPLSVDHQQLNKCLGELQHNAKNATIRKGISKI